MILAIDLDDTLYEEEDFVISGFSVVADKIAKINDLSKDLVCSQLIYQLKKYGRMGAFDRTLAYFDVLKPEVNSLVDIYREHEPMIKLYDGVADILKALQKIYNIIIVTDGLVSVQKNKIKALKLDSIVNDLKTIYCMEYNAPKPSIRLINIIRSKFSIDDDIIFIGDDPFCDMHTASLANIKSYRIRTGKYKSIPNMPGMLPDKEFFSFVEAAKYLCAEVRR